MKASFSIFTAGFILLAGCSADSHVNSAQDFAQALSGTTWCFMDPTASPTGNSPLQAIPTELVFSDDGTTYTEYRIVDGVLETKPVNGGKVNLSGARAYTNTGTIYYSAVLFPHVLNDNSIVYDLSISKGESSKTANISWMIIPNSGAPVTYTSLGNATQNCTQYISNSNTADDN